MVRCQLLCVCYEPILDLQQKQQVLLNVESTLQSMAFVILFLSYLILYNMLLFLNFYLYSTILEGSSLK